MKYMNLVIFKKLKRYQIYIKCKIVNGLAAYITVLPLR